MNTSNLRPEVDTDRCRLFGKFICIACVVLFFAHSASCNTKYNKQRTVCNSGGFKLVGDLYIHKDKKIKSQIVFLHGTTIKGFGRDLLFYRYICKELYKKGYNVFAYDARGYGESEGPDRVDSMNDLDFVGDVSNVITCLLKKEEQRFLDITLLGHSFGGGVAISAGIKDPRIKRIIAISPPRRIRERFLSDRSPHDFEWVRKIKSEDMGLSHLIPPELMKEMLETYDIENVIKTPFDKPILLIDGALESEPDRIFLKRIYEKIKGAKAYKTIEDAGHFFGTVEGLTVVNISEMQNLVTTIDQWIKLN